MTLEEMLRVITHEFVHACQQEINPDAENVEWFWEALATNLGNPFDCVASMQCEEDDLIYHLNDVPFSYEICFTIGKFMLESYSHEQIMDYVKNPDKLMIDAKTIFKEEKEWFHKKYLPLPSTPKAENDDFKIFAADSLDDFTAGHSTAGLLPLLPIDTVKFDKSLLDSFEVNQTKSMIVYKNLISLIKDLNFKIVSEGVETDEQLEFLKLLEVDYIQGYWFSKPILKDELTLILQQTSSCHKPS